MLAVWSIWILCTLICTRHAHSSYESFLGQVEQGILSIFLSWLPWQNGKPTDRDGSCFPRPLSADWPFAHVRRPYITQCSLPEIVWNPYRHNAWPWLAAHVLYSLCFTTTINAFLYIISLVINFRQLFANPSVSYSRDLEGYALDVAIERGYRRLKLFLLQLIALTLTYVLGAYFYKSIVRGTPVD